MNRLALWLLLLTLPVSAQNLTDQTELTTVADSDVLYIVDVSDTTDDAAGSSKKITKANLEAGMDTVPDGGTTGQVLKKVSATDQDLEWADESGGGGSATLAGLTDVTITSVADEEILRYDSGSGDWVNVTPFGRHEIETITNASAGEFDFSSIPSGFKRLVVLGYLRGDISATSDRLYALVNTETTASNYHSQRGVNFDGNNSSFAEAAEPIIGNVPANSAPSNSYGKFELVIENYSSSSELTVMEGRSRYLDSANYILQGDYTVVRDNAAAAITRLRIRTDNHSTDQLLGELTLYGEY